MSNDRNVSDNELILHTRSGAGLYNTVWPLEHADIWRSQSTAVGGLPADFNKQSIVNESINLDQPFTGYTRDKNQLFIMGGTPYLMDTYTKMYMTHSTYVTSDPSEDIISNRKHYAYIAKINPVTLATDIVELSLGRNRSVNYPGGALMHSNGFVYAQAQSILYKIDPDTMQILKTLELPLVEGKPGLAESTIYNGLLVLGNGRIITKCFTSSDIGNGWVLQIDPDTLEIIVAKFIEVQSARLMLDEPLPGVAYAYMPTLSQSRRFLITDNDFILDSEWTADYRNKDDYSTTWANGTLFMKNHVVFPDNSAPGEYITKPLHFFLHSVYNPTTFLQPHDAVSNVPGVNFWKVSGDPYSNKDQGLIITFTPTDEKIAAYMLYDNGIVEKVWERNYFVSASPAIVTSTDHLYINDFRNGHDNFVVLRFSTGEELAYIELPDVLETTMGIIFPGMNDDVYLCSTATRGSVNTGIFNRIFLKQ